MSPTGWRTTPGAMEDSIGGMGEMTRRSRKEEVIQAAFELFSEKGYKDTTTRDICRKTGLTSAGLYHYIKSKEELLNEVERNIYRDFEKLLEETPEDPVEDIRDFIRKYTELILTHKNILNFLIERSLFQGEGEYAEECIKRRRDFIVKVREKLDKIKEAGLADPEVKTIMATFNLMAMILWTSLWFNPDGPVSKDELIESIGDFFVKGFFKNKGK